MNMSNDDNEFNLNHMIVWALLLFCLLCKKQAQKADLLTKTKADSFYFFRTSFFKNGEYEVL